jgi:hypothetical protein
MKKILSWTILVLLYAGYMFMVLPTRAQFVTCLEATAIVCAMIFFLLLGIKLAFSN